MIKHFFRRPAYKCGMSALAKWRQEMSKALDEMTAAVSALGTAVEHVSDKFANMPPDESAQFEALATQVKSVADQLEALVNPPATGG